MVALAETSEVTQHRGVHFAGTPDLEQTTEVELESLPSPWLTAPPTREQWFVRWETERGCPFRCTFCQHRQPNPTWRPQRFHPSRIEQELELLADTAWDVAVLDPIFNLGSRSIARIDALRERRFRGRLSFQCRLLGTPLERERHRWQLRENDADIPSVIESSTFSLADWLEMARLARVLAPQEELSSTLEALDRRVAKDVAAEGGQSPKAGGNMRLSAGRL